MLAATLPVMEPIRPAETTATWAPPERILVLADNGQDMLTGSEVSGTLTLEGYGAAVVRK